MAETGTKILVVEDEPIVLHTLQLILKQHGYDVKGARDGTEALSVGLDFDPAILLCDINLPDIDGIQISLRLKKTLPSMRVILLSGEISSSELLDDASRAGHHFEVLAKPTEPQELLHVLALPPKHRDPHGIHRVK